MRIATWNVNSVRTRAERIVNLLQRHEIDVLTMQETKCTNERFPYLAFSEAGYEVAHVGFNQWNGVAIASRVGLEDMHTSLPDQPTFNGDVEARAISALIRGQRIWSLYMPNGRSIGHEHYDYKLNFYYQLASYVRGASEPLILMGDFNVAPRDEDVWDIRLFEGKTHVTEPERAAFQMVLEAGLIDVTPPGFTYYDYKSLRYPRREGMRIDFHLASPSLASLAKSGFIDMDERAGEGTSDHVPVIVDYDLPPAYDDVR